MQQALRVQRARVGQHAYVSFIHTRLTATAATGSNSSAASSHSLTMAAIEIKADKTFVQAPVPEFQEDAVLVTLPGKASNTNYLAQHTGAEFASGGPSSNREFGEVHLRGRSQLHPLQWECASR